MRVLILLSALFVTVLATAQVNTPNKRHAEAAIITSGNAIYDLCEHYKTDKLTGSLGPACLMYISGVTQTLILNDDTKLMTAPCPAKGVTEGQITDVVIKWLEDHPEKRNDAAPYLIMESLKEAFPCN